MPPEEVDLQLFIPPTTLPDVNFGLLSEARIHVRFGPRTPGGVRGYGKICLLAEALTQFGHSKIHIYFLCLL